MTVGRSLAHRHVFTSSARGALGAAGFQTVAASQDLWLREEVRRAIEQAVDGLRPPAEIGDLPVHQLLPISWHSGQEPGHWLLSRSVRTGATPEQRQGNFLVESQLLPQAWIAACDWDVDAVIDKLEWLGTEYQSAVRADDRLPTEELPIEKLPSPAAGSLDRLQIFTELPAPARRGLIEGIVSLGHSRAPLRLWLDHGSDLQITDRTLERLIRRLPLLLPPTCRWAQDAQSKAQRPITLRSLAEPRRGSPVDLEAGFHNPHGLRSYSGQVVALSSQDSRPQLPAALQAYASWLDQAVAVGDWPALADLYQRHNGRRLPDHHSLRRLDWSRAPLVPTADVTQAGAHPSLQQTLQNQQLLWHFRERVEVIMDDLQRKLELELDQLNRAFEQQVKEAVDARETELTSLQAEIDKTLGDLDRQQHQLLTELEQARAGQLKTLQQKTQQVKEDLKRQTRRHLKELNPPPPGKQVFTARAAKEDEADPFEYDPGEPFDSPRPVPESRPSTFKGKEEAQPEAGFNGRARQWALIAGAVAVLVIAFFGIRAYMGPADPEVVIPSTNTQDPAPEQDAGRLIDSLRQRLRAPAEASRLLTQAAADTQWTNRAQQLTVAGRLYLSKEPLSPQATCALVQAAIGMDADNLVTSTCGPTTATRLREWVNNRRSQARQTPLAAITNTNRAAAMAADTPVALRAVLGLEADCVSQWWPALRLTKPCAANTDQWADLALKTLAGLKAAQKPTAELEALVSIAPPTLKSDTVQLSQDLAADLVELAHDLAPGQAVNRSRQDLSLDQLSAQSPAEAVARINELKNFLDQLGQS